ncbi:MAG: hypothetical protein HLX50_01835 [Alteromonadaceae bacterium]|nr:hypothetical protein [Alteromonadaceae bacterium]
MTADAQSGRRYADKLIKVYAKDGSETWVLIHVEVQGEPEEDFAERMYTYQYRLRDRYGMDVVSLAVLADTRKSFRPTTFHYKRWGCGVIFTFPMAKLIDWEARWAELETSDNLFALVVMAQIRAKRVKDGASRKDTKVALTRMLFERGYQRDEIIRLFNIIDWMIQLPRGLEPEFVQAVYTIQEEKHMPYINTVERLEREKERQVGLQEGREKERREAERRALEEKRETVRHLLAFGVLSDEQIAEATGMALDEIARLRIEDKH